MKDPAAMDSFSKLTNDELQHILSFLSQKEVAAVAVLSRSWRCISESHPHLSFDDWCHGSLNDNNIMDSRKHFINFVDNSLQRFGEKRVRVKSFRLNMEGYSSSEQTHVNRWIDFVTRNHVAELYLSFQCNVYPLPNTTFSSKFLTVFYLSHCKLDEKAFQEKGSKCRALKELSLDCVQFSEKAMEKLITCCPCIYKLSLVCCFGGKTLNLSGLDKLEQLKLSFSGWHMDEDNFNSVTIDAPSLRQLYYCPYNEWLKKVDINACKNLEMLHLNCLNVSKVLKQIPLNEFTHLKLLMVQTFHVDHPIVVSSQWVETLETNILKNMFRLNVSKLCKFVFIDGDSRRT